MTPLAVVLGTYNRRAYLERALDSIRAHAGMAVDMIVVDGGSSDGAREYLRRQSDVTLIEQQGPLTGAVAAFNLGFGLAVDRGYAYVMHFNDDAELVTPGMLAAAHVVLAAAPSAGALAFEHDLRGTWGFESVHGLLYPNYGIIRRDVGMEVARMQGDPTGRAWWNPIFRTYAADCELGCWIHALGYDIHAAKGMRVHDCKADDELSRTNQRDNPTRADSVCFWQRWPNRDAILGPKRRPLPPPRPPSFLSPCLLGPDGKLR